MHKTTHVHTYCTCAHFGYPIKLSDRGIPSKMGKNDIERQLPELWAGEQKNNRRSVQLKHTTSTLMDQFFTTQFLSNRYDISLKTTNVNFIMDSREVQSHESTSSGDHECPLFA